MRSLIKGTRRTIRFIRDFILWGLVVVGVAVYLAGCVVLITMFSICDYVWGTSSASEALGDLLRTDKPKHKVTESFRKHDDEGADIKVYGTVGYDAEGRSYISVPYDVMAEFFTPRKDRRWRK